MKNTTNQQSQLPNAPLVEVVFELHWKLQGDESIPKQLWNDPGYPLLAEEFVFRASRYGFKKIKKMGSKAMLAAHSIGLRLYKSEEQPFPLWQIGPGVFASNESATYEWKTFKKLALDGVKLLLSSYPKIKEFGLTPSYLELRYIDSFDSSLFPSQNSMTFLNKKTSLNVELPPFLTKRPLGKTPKAKITFEFPVTNKKDTFFRVDVGGGAVKDKKTIVLTSKVISELKNIRVGKTDSSRIKYISAWLELAHSLTSPFFKDFINETLMDEFKRDPNASR
jgi:uncharacterized protein (TIGR04255 family)